MDFAHAPHVEQWRARLQRFLDDLVLPAHAEWLRYVGAGVYPLDVIEPLKQQARALGLWNLFLPGLRDGEPGTRLTNLEYAPLAELMGRVPWSSEVFNCNAPDTGNIELLHRFATPAQAERWLAPLLAGEIPINLCEYYSAYSKGRYANMFDSVNFCGIASSPVYGKIFDNTVLNRFSD